MNRKTLVKWITILAVLAMASQVAIDTDTWWHLRAGKWIVDHQAVPQADPFSYTRAGAEWKYPGWLVEVPMYAIFQSFGPGGLNAWAAIMVTAAFVFLWLTLPGGEFLKAFIIVLAAAVSGVYWAARPYLVTFVLAAVFLFILDGSVGPQPRTSLRRLLWLPLLMVIWVNSHGGFITGFILWGVYVCGALLNLLPDLRGGKVEFTRLAKKQLVPLFGVGLLLILAVCLNPAGPQMLTYPLKTVEIGALQDYIQEWQPPDFHSRQAQPFIWMLLLTFGTVGASRRRLNWTDGLLFAVFTYMTLLAWRNAPLFALAAALTLARQAEPLLQTIGRGLRYRADVGMAEGRRERVFNALLLGLLGLAALARVIVVLPAEASKKVYQKTVPVEAVNFLRGKQPPGRLFNSYNWGGYLLWALPEYPVFVDGRTDLYNDEILNQWLQVVRGEDGWQQTLDRWQVRLILVEPEMDLVQYLPEAGWKQLYADQQAVIYSR